MFKMKRQWRFITGRLLLLSIVLVSWFGQSYKVYGPWFFATSLPLTMLLCTSMKLMVKTYLQTSYGLSFRDLDDVRTPFPPFSETVS